MSRFATNLLQLMRETESQDPGFSARCGNLLREVLTTEAADRCCEELLSGRGGVPQQAFEELLAWHTLLERSRAEDPGVSALWSERGIPERLSRLENALLERAGCNRVVMLQRLTAERLGVGLRQASQFVTELPTNYRRELGGWISEHQPDHPISLWMQDLLAGRSQAEQQLMSLCERQEGPASAFKHYFDGSAPGPAFVREVAALGCRGRQSRFSVADVAALLAAPPALAEGLGVGVERLMAGLLGQLKQVAATRLQKEAKALQHRELVAIRSSPEEALKHLLALMQGQRPATARFSSRGWRELLAAVQTALEKALEPAAMALRVREMMADPVHRGLLEELQRQMRLQVTEQSDCPLRQSVWTGVEQALDAAHTESFRWRGSGPVMLRAELESLEAQLAGADAGMLQTSPGRPEQRAALVSRREELAAKLVAAERGRADVLRWMPEADKSRRHGLQTFLDAAESHFMERGLTSPWCLLRQFEQEGLTPELHELTCKLSAWLHGVPLSAEVVRMLSNRSVNVRLDMLFAQWFDGHQTSVHGALAILDYAGLVGAATAPAELASASS